MKIWEDVLKRARQVDLSNSPEPEDEVADGEEVLGILPRDFRRFWVLLRENSNKLKRINERIRLFPQKPDEDEMRKIERAVVALKGERQILQTIIWTHVENMFPQVVFSGRDLALRRGWRVVSVEPELTIPDIFNVPTTPWAS